MYDEIGAQEAGESVLLEAVVRMRRLHAGGSWSLSLLQTSETRSSFDTDRTRVEGNPRPAKLLISRLRLFCDISDVVTPAIGQAASVFMIDR